MRSTTINKLAIVAVTVAAAVSCSSGKSKNASTSTSPTREPSIGHVFVVNLENKDYAETWSATSPARYLNGTLRAAGQLLTHYYGIGHASLGNYIAQISGQAPNPVTQADCPKFVEFESTRTDQYDQAVGQGCVYPATVKTVADQLRAARKTWKSYQEDLGNSPTDAKTCRHPAIGAVDTTLLARKTDMYATRHNPFVYFHSIIDTPECAERVVALDELTADLQTAGTTPNLVYITPNLCHDGHDEPCVDGQPGGLKSADDFLAEWVPKILASPAYRADGMLVVTFDEAEGSDATACCNTPASPNAPKPGIAGPGGGRVGAVVVTKLTRPASTNDTPYNHYSLLCSIEDVFSLDHLGFAGAPGLACFGRDVYNH